jgi:flavin reductase (DIM6/NTAB) family NADH-FMN oxidoreductase RutF
MSFSSFDFRRAMSHFATGITVVTTAHDGINYGITVNAFCSVSLEPPLVLICIDKTTYPHNVLKLSKFYGVNMLSEEQQYLSQRFANRESMSSFEDLKFFTITTGAPLLEETLASLDCRVVAEHDGGDHTIFVAEVLALRYTGEDETEPLLYYRSNYRFFGKDK